MTMTHSVVTEEAIRDLVDAFYARVRQDPALGPIFETALHGSWDDHMTKMYAFWSSVMLTTGRYKGNPLATHLNLPPFPPALFDQWLTLFAATAQEICTHDIATQFEVRAQRIAESLKLGLYFQPGQRAPSAA
jgi:hemoglobin